MEFMTLDSVAPAKDYVPKPAAKGTHATFLQGGPSTEGATVGFGTLNGLAVGKTLPGGVSGKGKGSRGTFLAPKGPTGYVQVSKK